MRGQTQSDVIDFPHRRLILMGKTGAVRFSGGVAKKAGAQFVIGVKPREKCFQRNGHRFHGRLATVGLPG